MNLRLYKNLVWDYNFTAQQIRSVLLGQVQSIGHLTTHYLFKRVLQSYNMNTIMKIMTKQRFQELLMDFDIEKLRFQQLKQIYGKMKQELPC